MVPAPCHDNGGNGSGHAVALAVALAVGARVAGDGVEWLTGAGVEGERLAHRTAVCNVLRPADRSAIDRVRLVVAAPVVGRRTRRAGAERDGVVVEAHEIVPLPRALTVASVHDQARLAARATGTREARIGRIAAAVGAAIVRPAVVVHGALQMRSAAIGVPLRLETRQELCADRLVAALRLTAIALVGGCRRFVVVRAPSEERRHDEVRSQPSQIFHFPYLPFSFAHCFEHLPQQSVGLRAYRGAISKCHLQIKLCLISKWNFTIFD